jgi:hypothetical protein
MAALSSFSGSESNPGKRAERSGRGGNCLLLRLPPPFKLFFFLLDLFFDSEDGCSMYVRNDGCLSTGYTVLWKEAANILNKQSRTADKR